MSHSPVINHPILNSIKNCNVLLDVGCGFGEWGFLFKTHKNTETVVGIDRFKKRLKRLHRNRIYDHLIVCQAPYLPFKHEVFDVSLVCELLEHMKKKDGQQLLKRLNALSKLIVVSTPLNYPLHSQDYFFDNHICEWSIKEFARLGFKVKEACKYPRTVAFFDRIRRVVLRLPKLPVFLIGWRKNV